MHCFIVVFLTEIHTKKVRKVPPGLPSSVSDNMPFLFEFYPYFQRIVTDVCVSVCEGKGAESVALLCLFVEVRMTKSWTRTAVGFFVVGSHLGGVSRHEKKAEKKRL